MIRLIRSILFGGIAVAAMLSGVAQGQAISSHAVPYTEGEYQKKLIFGADADDYWTGYWDWYDNTYRPYYYTYGRPVDPDLYGYRHHTRRPALDRSDRFPSRYPEYHDYYIDEGRTNRLRSPSYYYPSTGVDARLYNWR